MAANGFDVAAGDTWARQRALVGGPRAAPASRGRTSRDSSAASTTATARCRTVKGVVFVVGVGQATADLSTYKVNTQDWYQDAAFWSECRAYVSDWSQELYGDVRDYAVAGASRSEAARLDLNDYLQHAAGARERRAR